MIAGAVGPIFTFLDSALKRAFPDKTERDRIQAQLEQAVLQGDLALLQGQMAINAEEAKSTSLFVAGWRPFIGWTCGSAYAYTFVVEPFIRLLVTLYGADPSALPRLSTGDLMPVLLGLLGLGGMRTFEKYARVGSGH